ncbi:class 1 isoprenoid biosynthesis enzyme [Silvibacterium sp.]|uniref:class 1 isoprenoid biosynthesis enzyme n=1 Tax=Silvibacterium sp. TaxID=1964179 RepID=UPI0039E5116C
MHASQQSVTAEAWFPPLLLQTAHQAIAAALFSLRTENSVLSSNLLHWISSRCPLDDLREYFLHPQAMPLLVLPWWLEESLRGEVDPAFQASLIAASIDGYFFIRMLDDVMDGHPVSPAALPAMHLFSLRFHSAYHSLFPADHPFWDVFESALQRTAEAESADAMLASVSEAEFLSITARKSAAALIPIAAVCFRYGREDVLPAWRSLLDTFAPWHQMHDDLLDWSEDLAAGQTTWLLSEAERQKASDETVAVWIGRKGLRWAAERMSQWMQQLREIAAELGSPEVSAYLDGRDALFRRQIDARIRLASLCESVLVL